MDHPAKALPRPKRVLALLIRISRWLGRVQKRQDLNVLVSNLFLLLRPLEFFQYLTTLFTLGADSPHLSRRIFLIERNRSKLFLRPLKFLLVTVTMLGLIILLVGKRLPPTFLSGLPENTWQRSLLLAGIALLSPFIVAILSLVFRFFVLLAAWYMPRKRVEDPEMWWGIPFLFDPKTWRLTRKTQLIQYLIYFGPYVVLTSGLLALAALAPFRFLNQLIWNYPGRLSPESAVFIFRIVWVGFWAALAERIVVNSFTAGLPMIMSGPTFALTRMVIPKLNQHLKRLKKIVAIIQTDNPSRAGVDVSGPLAEVMVDLELDVAVYRSFHFPFQTDFTLLYPLDPLLDAVADYAKDVPEASKLAALWDKVLRGTSPTRFEEPSVAE